MQSFHGFTMISIAGVNCDYSPKSCKVWLFSSMSLFSLWIILLQNTTLLKHY